MIDVIPWGGDAAKWDAFVAGAEGSTFCHLASWHSVMERALGHECPYLVAVDGDGEWQGVLPLVRVRSPLLGHYLVSMPFLNAGGPLGTIAAQEALVRRAARDASRIRADLLELRTRQPVPGGLKLSHRKITVTLDLPATAEALWEAFPSKLRSQIRKPQKAGMTVRYGTDQRASFYSVFARNMRALGTPVLPEAWFEAIAAAFGERVEFACVYAGEVPVAAGCGFLWRDEFELVWASSLREYSAGAPNMLLYWSLMERMISRGARRFDFGRCTPGGSTHRFKLQWGGSDVLLPWAQWSARNVTATPSPERPAFKLAAACWKRLPLAVTNRVGPVLARQIP